MKPELLAMLDEVERRYVDMLIVWRDTEDSEDVKNLIQDHLSLYCKLAEARRDFYAQEVMDAPLIKELNQLRKDLGLSPGTLEQRECDKLKAERDEALERVAELEAEQSVWREEGKQVHGQNAHGRWRGCR